MTQKLAMVTCYDATFAKIASDTEAFDYLLVGDSAGMVLGGATSTLEVTLEQMLAYTKSVSRGILASKVLRKPLLIADMPAGTYSNSQKAVHNAKEFLKVGAQMVKIEGCEIEVVRALRSEDISVCGHIGLTPQSILEFKVQGKTQEGGLRLQEEAQMLQRAGCGLLVLEMIPALLAKRITKSLSIPTIGIGAGAECSGQVLVLYDLLGFNPDFSPKFLKKFGDGYAFVSEALKSYAAEVREGRYPGSEHSFRGSE